MSVTLNKIFDQIAEYSKTMGKLHTDFLRFVLADTDRFIKLTENLSNQMNWQGRTIIGLTVLSTGLGIAGKLIPPATPGANPNSSPLDPRLGANDGITDWFSTTVKAIQQKLSDNNFLRTTCKTTAKFSSEIQPAARIWFESAQTTIQTKCDLIKTINLKNDQDEKSMADQEVQRALEAARRMLDCKSRGGV
jgi:hypothetical protein